MSTVRIFIFINRVHIHPKPSTLLKPGTFSNPGTFPKPGTLFPNHNTNFEIVYQCRTIRYGHEGRRGEVR
jgi:hypothetical protein